MKEFNLELAKAGYSVQTRDGRPVRILCYDVKGHDYPIMALVMEKDNKEMPYLFTLIGSINNSAIESSLDLFMNITKKEGWVNIYRSSNGTMYTEQERVYNSEEEAIAGKFDRTYNRVYVTSKKIEWEE